MRIFDSNSKIVDSELKAFPKLRALVVKAVKLNLLEAAYATGTNFNFNPFSPEGQCLLEHIGGMTAQLSLEAGMPSFSATCVEDLNYLALLPLQDSFRFDYLLATHRKNLLTASIALSQEFDDLKSETPDDEIKASRIDLIHQLFLEHKLIKKVFFILPELSSPLYKELNKIHLHLKEFFLGTSGLLDKINRYLNGKIKEIDQKTCLDAIYSGLFYIWGPTSFFKCYTWNLSSQFPDASIQYLYAEICYRFGTLLKSVLICEKFLISKMNLASCFDYLVRETKPELEVYRHITWASFEKKNSSDSIISLKDRVQELELLNLLLKRNKETQEAQGGINKILLQYRLLLRFLRFHGEVASLWEDLLTKYDPCHTDFLKTPIEELHEDIHNFVKNFMSLNRLKIKFGKVNGPDFCKLVFEAFFEIAKKIETGLYRAKNGIFLDEIGHINDKLSGYQDKIEKSKKVGIPSKNYSKKIQLQLDRLVNLHFLYNSPKNVLPFWEDEKTLAHFKEVKDRGLSLILTLNENIKQQIKSEAITPPGAKPLLSF